MSLRVTKGNRLSNVYEHPFRMGDATSVGHLLREIADLQKAEDSPAGYLVWYELMTLHPATDSENRMLHPIDNIGFAPRVYMPKFDIKAIHEPVHLEKGLVFQSALHQEYGSNIAILLPERHMQNLRSEEHTSELQSRQYLVCRL